MSLGASRFHLYQREVLKKDTSFEVLMHDSEDWDHLYLDDIWDDDYYWYDWRDEMEWLAEKELEENILLSFEYECFGCSEGFVKNSGWRINFEKNGRKKFTFGIDSR